MKITVQNLTDAQLIWAIAKAEGYIDDCNSWLYQATVKEANDSGGWQPLTWAVAGPIIEREMLALIPTTMTGNYAWEAKLYTENKQYGEYGPTPLIAAMRCYVASKLGDEVDVPDDLT